jgi:hypothetical protein
VTAGGPDGGPSTLGPDVAPDTHVPPRPRPRRLFHDYSFAWITGLLFAASLLGQLGFQAADFGNEAAAHGGPFVWAEFWPYWAGAVLENWQSEMLQLLWQVIGLAYLLYRGSSQSREQDDRIEAMLGSVLRRVSAIEARGLTDAGRAADTGPLPDGP